MPHEFVIICKLIDLAGVLRPKAEVVIFKRGKRREVNSSSRT